MLLFIFSSLNSTTSQQLWQNYLTFDTTNTWYEFAQNTQDLNQPDWAWIGLITFKAKNILKLKKIELKWSGKHIDTNNISASLYQKKELIDKLLPVEENLVCDGTWNKKNQQITFWLDEKLIAVKKYYLLLSFPKECKNKLRSGQFTISDDNSLKLLTMNKQ